MCSVAELDLMLANLPWAIARKYPVGSRPTVREFARETGLSPTTAARVLRGETPSIKTLRVVLEWLEADDGG